MGGQDQLLSDVTMGRFWRDSKYSKLKTENVLKKDGWGNGL